jgi:hypothetical protein
MNKIGDIQVKKENGTVEKNRSQISHMIIKETEENKKNT